MKENSLKGNSFSRGGGGGGNFDTNTLGKLGSLAKRLVGCARDTVEGRNPFHTK